MTYGDIANQQQRVLAFSAEDALDWLESALEWEQAQQLAARLNSAQPHLEPAMTTHRPAQGGTTTLEAYIQALAQNNGLGAYG